MKHLKFIFLLSTIFQLKNISAQEPNSVAKKDSLQNPMFYLMMPKIVDINGRLTPKYNVAFSDPNATKYNYKNEFIGSINLALPIIPNKNGWIVSGLFDYYNFSYQSKRSDTLQTKNYSTFRYGARVVKRFRYWNKMWILSNSFSTLGSSAGDFKNISYVPSLMTSFTFRGNSKLMVGLAVIFDRNVLIPAIPILNYSTWLSKQKGLLLGVKLPMVDIHVAKIFNNRTLLKGGINLLNQGHYIKASDVPFLAKKDNYMFRRLQFALNTKYEKAFYKMLWFSCELGYAVNFNTAVFDHDEDVLSDRSLKPSNLYFNIGMFVRPTKLRRRK